MDWPAQTREVNPVENHWERLDRDVYANGRQFAAVQDLLLQTERSFFFLF